MAEHASTIPAIPNFPNASQSTMRIRSPHMAGYYSHTWRVGATHHPHLLPYVVVGKLVTCNQRSKGISKTVPHVSNPMHSKVHDVLMPGTHPPEGTPGRGDELRPQTASQPTALRPARRPVPSTQITHKQSQSMLPSSALRLLEVGRGQVECMNTPWTADLPCPSCALIWDTRLGTSLVSGTGCISACRRSHTTVAAV